MLLRLHALFIAIREFVTDSFSYPVAEIFHMAWFAAPLHVRPVDVRPLGGPLTTAARPEISTQRGFYSKAHSFNRTGAWCDDETRGEG